MKLNVRFLKRHMKWAKGDERELPSGLARTLAHWQVCEIVEPEKKAAKVSPKKKAKVTKKG